MDLTASELRKGATAPSWIRKVLSWGGGSDGRVLLVLLLAIYFGAVGYWAPTQGWEQAWRHVRVPSMPADFADTRGILSSYDRFRGGAPMDQVQLAPLNRAHTYSMTYPRTWLAFAYLGLGESATYPVALTLIVACFGLSLWYLGRLTWGQAAVFAPLWIAPSLMLGVERGNADLLMYLMVLIACCLFSRRAILGACVVLLGAGMLKLYPVAAMVPALRHRRGLAIVSGCAVLFLLFCFIDRHDLAWVNHYTPREAGISFGALVISAKWHVSQTIGLGLAAVCALVAVVSARRSPVWSVSHDMQGSGFLAGCSILTLCFVIGNNYMYRWWFGLLLLPQLVRWIMAEGPEARWAGWLLTALIMTTWAISESRLWLIGMVLNWLIFGGLLYGLASVMLPVAWRRQ